MGNILFRYGYYASLNFVLEQDGNHLGPPRQEEPFNLGMMDPVPWHKDFMENRWYQILAMHTKWNQTAVEYDLHVSFREKKCFIIPFAHIHSAILGKDALLITLFREPSSAFESLFSYYKFATRYDTTIHDYIEK